MLAAVAVLAAVCAWLARRNRALEEENERLRGRLSVGKTDGRSGRGEEDGGGADGSGDADGSGGGGDGDKDGDRDGGDGSLDGADGSADGCDDGGDDEKEGADMEKTDADDELFASIDRRIDEGQLYLDQGFGRDSICRLTGLSKERVGQLIKRYGGVGNLQVYVNRKRAAYAKQLMHEHKNYTMEAIANECGIGNLSTFYRIFKQVYGVSPAEFRRSVDNAVAGD